MPLKSIGDEKVKDCSGQRGACATPKSSHQKPAVSDQK